MAQPPPRIAADVPAHGPPASRRSSGIRAHGVSPRAMLIGALLTPILCWWTLYSEIVAQSTELAVMSLSVAVVFALLVLLLLNGALRRWLPRLALDRSELLFVYVMQTSSIAISGVGMMQFLHIGLANVYWYATPENQWAEKYHPLLKSWAFPDPKYLRGYYLGQTTFFTREHMLAWLSPILVWTGFILVLLTVMFCLNVVLRRRWVDQERLTFPITALPLELTRDGGGPFFRNRVMWTGFAVAMILETLAGIAYLYPSVPFVPIKPSDPRLNLPVSLLPPPWNAVGDLQMGLYPMVIGLTYLLPLDVSFSCWFFFFLRKLEDVAATGFGFRDPGASMALARIPYYGEQAFGAFFGFAIFSLWSMRGYLTKLLQAAIHPRRDDWDDREEPISYRAALIGLTVGFLLLVGFAVALGLAAYLAVLFFALYLLVVITYTRIRAEAGLPWAFGPDMTPHQMIVTLQGTGSMAMSDMVALTEFQWMDLDYRCTIMPHQLEAMKIATDAGMDRRGLWKVMLLAATIATLASWIGLLACYYKFGASSAQVDGWRTSMGNSPWRLLDSWSNSPTHFDPPRIAGAAAGVVIIGLLMVARTRLLWWPLHPIGYALAGTFTMPWLWCPVLIGWMLKAAVLRYGGMRIHRIAMPFFIGLILGDYVAGSLWALVGCFTGAQTYKVIPI
jgi:hypothetical protein